VAKLIALLMAGACFALARAAPVVLFVIGDTGDCELDGTARVAAAVRAQPDAAKAKLIEVGDLAYPVATRERLLECHEPYWAVFDKRLAVPGNHDWPNHGAAGFFSIFPEPVPRKVALGDGWHLLLLNSNLRDEAWQAQLDWLDSRLKQSRGECLIAAWHHPRWSSGKHGDNAFVQALWTRLQGKATFTLHGHDHHFEALPALDADGQPNTKGVASFIAGNGGATLYPPGDRARSQRALFGQWGFLRIELEGPSYRWQAFGVDGARKDGGHGACRPATAN
jgi:hypothetical protein